jgi:hypothetical protein
VLIIATGEKKQTTKKKTFSFYFAKKNQMIKDK